MLQITPAQAAAIIATRDTYDEKTRKRRKAAIFAQIKAEHGLRSTQKIKFEIDNPNSPDYLVIKDGETGLRLQSPKPLAPPKREASYPFPGGEKAQAGTPAKSLVKPAIRGLTLDESMPHQVQGGHAVAADAYVRLKLGSVSLDDLLELLRAEGETIGSFATSEDHAPNSVFVRGDRLFFVR